MMTITIDAPAEVEATIAQKAAREGLSVSEYVLRAAIERPVRNSAEAVPNVDSEAKERAARRKASRELVKSGYFARTGLSTQALFADRREEARLEAEQEARREVMRQTEKGRKEEGTV